MHIYASTKTALKQTFLSYIFTAFPRSLLQNFHSDISNVLRLAQWLFGSWKLNPSEDWKNDEKCNGGLKNPRRKTNALINSIEKKTRTYEEKVITNMPWKRPSWRKAQKMLRIQVKVTSTDAYLLNGMHMNTFH